jgi:glycosyltransferase 2 family protein
MKKYAKLLLKLAVSIVLIGVIVFKIDKDQLITNLKLLNPIYIPLIVIFIVLNYIVSSMRWKRLLIHANTHHVSVGYLTTLYFVGSFFNNFMPTSIGGDVYKVYKLGKKIDNMPNAFSATFMERFTGVLMLGAISLFSLYKLLGLWIILLCVWAVIGLYLAFLLLRALSRKNRKIDEIYCSFKLYKGKTGVIAYALATSLFVQLFSILSQYVIFLALGVKLPFLYALFVFPVIILAGFFIPSLNGIGVQDTMYMTLFGVVGVSPELALSASILFHLFKLFISLVGGVLYALGKAE